MANQLKRMTFAVTSDMETQLKTAKKEQFYDCTYSEMLRRLIIAGLNSTEKEHCENTD